jgi:hypothetical protein
VDFGKGPEIVDVRSGEIFKTWVFVMVPAWSHHQYAELVRNQSVETWLDCHRPAFEHFNGVPLKIIIDYVPGNVIDIMWSHIVMCPRSCNPSIIKELLGNGTT